MTFRHRVPMPAWLLHSRVHRPVPFFSFVSPCSTASVMNYSDAEASATPSIRIPTRNDNNGNEADEVSPTQSLPERCARVHAKVYALLKRRAQTDRLREVQRQTSIGLEVIGKALQRYTLHELSFSYNGGKDCLVLLILYLAALHSHSIGEQAPTTGGDDVGSPHQSQRTTLTLPPTLRSVYIVTPNPFPAVAAFVSRSSAQYHLSLAQYDKPMKDAFASYLADFPEVKAIFVGTRRTDPHGASLTHFDPTTDDWPDFMRIHPVIDWHYADIWDFIREVGVEYCELYDQGYTSLGGTDDTHPNPALAVTNELGRHAGETAFRPAYELREDFDERLGRDR